jgi:DHA2 family multidrug resistance protein
MATTLLVRREQFHQFRLTEHLYQSSLLFQQALQRAASDLVARGTSMADAQHQAIGIIEQLVQHQASLISYMDVFYAFAVATFAMIFVILLLVRPIELRGHTGSTRTTPLGLDGLSLRQCVTR